MDSVPVQQQPQEILQEEERYDSEEAMEVSSSSRKFTTESKASSRLLMSAINGATRLEPSPTRQIPSRVHDNNRQNVRREPRDRSISPVRSRTANRGRDNDSSDRIRFRRTSEERSRDEANISARLGPINDHSGRRNISDRLGDSRLRDRSRDDKNDYHDRRGRNDSNRNNNSNNNSPPKSREQALRDIERRLGPRSVNLNGNRSAKSNNRERSYEPEIQENSNDVKPPRCKFWPNCSQGDQCQYWHPKELCQLYPNCPSSAETCYYVHPLAQPTADQLAAAARAQLQAVRSNTSNGFENSSIDTIPGGNALQNGGALGAAVECKFGLRCTRSDCMFRHSDRDAKQPCRFFPQCTKPNCPFYHPAHGELIANSSMETTSENVTRLPIPCKFGDQCTRPGCHFTHPRDGEIAQQAPLCRFNPCTRSGCPFRHVPGSGLVGGNKTWILNSNTNTPVHNSERLANLAVDESQVEKLYVPASTHWSTGGVSHQPDATAEAATDMDMDVAI
ncbi:hypothetical protein BG004_007720 [Podila humilis]|nr:hypothetical protein BG004_007720 [Podila humilis]